MTNPGPKILVQGDVGVGKTFSLRQLPSLGLETFVVFTEQSMETIADVPDIHWHYIAPRTPNIKNLIEFIEKKVLVLSADALARVEDPNRKDARQFLELLSTLTDFTDQNGENFGPVDDWGPERVLVLDTLTGTTRMCLETVTGARVIRSFPEWNIASDLQISLIEKLCALRCSVIVNAHLEPERDEVSGRIRLYPSAIGRKIGPIIIRHFGEVIHAKREGDAFVWDTASSESATKQRLLPLHSALKQDYSQIFNKWRDLEETNQQQFAIRNNAT